MKTYDNIIDLLDDKLSIHQQEDNHDYYPMTISITISKKNIENKDKFDL